MIQSQLPRRGLISRWVAAMLAGLVLCPAWALAETWTSLRGTHSVDAKLVGLWDGNVILELSNGRRVSVKLNDLRSESRIQAQELARQLDSSRGDRINRLKGQATEAAAPAPNPLPVPPAAPEYKPPQPNQSSTNFFAEYDQAIAAGHLLAMYDALPPSYRQDINDIVMVTAQRIDPNAWRDLISAIQRFGDIIVTRQRWFISSPRIQSLPPEQIEMAQGPLVTFADLLRVGLDPEAMQLERLQNMDFRQWLAERDQAIAPYLAQLFQQIGPDALRQVTVETEVNGVATASIDVNGVKRKVTYQWVDGYWVPKSLADNWATTVQNWKQSPDSNLATLLTTAAIALQPVAPALDGLATAPDAGAFHEAMETVFTPAQTIVTSVAALLGRNLGGRGNAQNGYGNYGDDSDMMMEDYQSQMMSSDDLDAQYRNQNYGQNYGQQGGP